MLFKPENTRGITDNKAGYLGERICETKHMRGNLKPNISSVNPMNIVIIKGRGSNDLYKKIRMSTLYLRIIHNHTPAIRAHQIHINRQLFSHLITILRLPHRLLLPLILPLLTLIHQTTHLEPTDRETLSRVTIKLTF